MSNRENCNLIESNDLIKDKIEAVLIKSDDKKIGFSLKKVKQGKNKDIRNKAHRTNSNYTEMINDSKVDTIDIPCKQAKVIELSKENEQMKTSLDKFEKSNKKQIVIEYEMKQVKSDLNQSNNSLIDKNKELTKMKEAVDKKTDENQKMKKELLEKQKLIQLKEKELEQAKMEIKKQNSNDSDYKVEQKTKNNDEIEEIRKEIQYRIDGCIHNLEHRTIEAKVDEVITNKKKKEVKEISKTAKTVNTVAHHKNNKNIRLLKFGEHSLYFKRV